MNINTSTEIHQGKCVDLGQAQAIDLRLVIQLTIEFEGNMVSGDALLVGELRP